METIVKKFARDVLEAAFVAAPALFVALNGDVTKKTFVTALVTFGAAFVAALRRKYFPQVAS